ncbi:hypothetical protein [Desulfovermiculus halophilus]|jgi:hypothetical protein|uniref:hypothetical protein n=1 Tax=Desulfovermiculus halophilus TaxID=339722 RepID=UPI00048676AF|nr:hypothetical protein [Desulfovermiculus halophilus]
MQEIIPEWMQSSCVDDAAFEQAYAASGAWERALIKTAIAGVYTWLQPQGTLRRITQSETPQGLWIHALTCPRPWAAVHIPAACSGPAQIVGAVLPVLAAGVWPVIVVLEEDADRRTALTALELSGVETVCILPGTEMQASVQAWLGLAGPGPGLVVQIEGGIPACQECSCGEGHMLLTLPRPRRAGVWRSGQEIDLQALAFAHPGLEFSLWSGQTLDLPPGWEQDNGSWTEFLGRSWDAVWVPKARVQEALAESRLAFGPGQESLWIWPWFHSGLAGYTRLGMRGPC